MIDREKLIEREAEKFASIYGKDSDCEIPMQECCLFDNKKYNFIAGINSDLNKKLRELDVVEARIEALKEVSLISYCSEILSQILYVEIMKLESKREEIIKSLNKGE